MTSRRSPWPGAPGTTNLRQMDDIATETATANGTEVPDELLDDELLVEEISIAGMCGVS